DNVTRQSARSTLTKPGFFFFVILYLFPRSRRGGGEGERGCLVRRSAVSLLLTRAGRAARICWANLLSGATWKERRTRGFWRSTQDRTRRKKERGREVRREAPGEQPSHDHHAGA
ncbi:unnamed protein product, partial [Ectocarpus sp. 12 AP-2014]